MAGQELAIVDNRYHGIAIGIDGSGGLAVEDAILDGHLPAGGAVDTAVIGVVASEGGTSDGYGSGDILDGAASMPGVVGSEKHIRQGGGAVVVVEGAALISGGVSRGVGVEGRSVGKQQAAVHNAGASTRVSGCVVDDITLIQSESTAVVDVAAVGCHGRCCPFVEKIM